MTTENQETPNETADSLDQDKSLSQDGEPETYDEVLETRRQRQKPEPEQHLQATEKFVAILPQGQIELTSSMIRLDGLMQLGARFLVWHKNKFPKMKRGYIG